MPQSKLFNSLLLFVAGNLFMMAGLSTLSFGILLYFLILGNPARNLSLATVCLLAAAFLVWSSRFGDLGTTEKLNSIITSSCFTLVIFAPLFSIRYRIVEARTIDFAIVGYVLIYFVLHRMGKAPEAYYQVASFSFIHYLYFAQSRSRQVLIGLAILPGGARSIFAGAGYGLLAARFRKAHRILSGIGFFLLAAAILSGFLFPRIEDYLLELQSQRVFLKGRTNFWLALLQLDPTYFGHGAGTSVATVSRVAGFHQLPHNEYLRIYVDYGIVSLLLFLFVLWRCSLKSPVHLFATAVLAAFCLFGNPLSFPAVIVCYLVFIHLKRVEPVRSLLPGPDRGLPETPSRSDRTPDLNLPPKASSPPVPSD